MNRLNAVFANLVDGLCDPRRQRRMMLALAAAYGVAWFVYGVVAKSSQDLNADLAEMTVWAHEPALGYPKHPPLLAYVVRLWFAVFPQADWAFALLAALTLSAGIYLAFELCGLWLDGEKRAAAPFLLAVIPFYNFLGLKFDQNSALIPLWALAMLALMRALETRRSGWAAVLGLAAAAAMLVKYWSIFLLAAMALAVLFDRRRDAFVRSRAPWIGAAVFLVLTVPHLVWLVNNHFPPLNWIGVRRTADSVFDFFRSLSEYSFGTIGYAAPAVILVALVIRPSGEAVRDSWFVMEPARRPATLLFWTPLLLPIAVAVIKHTNLLVALERAIVEFAAGDDAGVAAGRRPAARGDAPCRLRGGLHRDRAHGVASGCADPAQTRRRKRRRLFEARCRGRRTAMARNHGGAAKPRRRRLRAVEFGGLLYGRPAVQLRRFFRLFVAVGDTGTHRTGGHRDRLRVRRRLVRRPDERLPCRQSGRPAQRGDADAALARPRRRAQALRHRDDTAAPVIAAPGI